METKLVGLNVNGYMLTEYLGKGNFGSVYKCEKDTKIYALKIFNIDYVFEEFIIRGGKNRIIREIESLKRVKHENVISYYDHGQFEHNKQTYVFVVMEYLKGQDLKEYLSNNNLDITKVKTIFLQILDGIEAIHKAGIIHRDLKPSNIFLTNNNLIKILDFGLVKIIDFTAITSTGDRIGSPIYMSPEQIKDSKNIDYRSDYYTLGVILFKLLVKKYPYGSFNSEHELYYKIINEPPESVTLYNPDLPNYIDNLILDLLKKNNYERPNNINVIKNYFNIEEEKKDTSDLLKSNHYYLRTWNEKSIFSDLIGNKHFINKVIFPINHQTQQKGLLEIIKKNAIDFFFDPATMRLAYDTFADVKGLVALPYAPGDYNKLEIDDFKDINKKRAYVELVVKEQLKHNPNYIVPPFHVSNNSTFSSIKQDSNESWFTIDIKLLNETKEYLAKNNLDKKLVGAFCIKADILTTKKERDFFLNIISRQPCDLFWIYVDCINYESNKSQLYYYIFTLLKLQEITKKPVIAGRINTLGLLLIAFDLYGFETGAARFESFYEDLYKEEAESYNMFVRYYIPELLRSVAVKRKDPSKMINILKTDLGIDIKCKCPYCKNKEPAQFLQDSITKKHFIYLMNQEIVRLHKLPINDRILYMEERIDKALLYYKKLRVIFKDNDYSYLKYWKEIIPKLKDEFNL